MDDYTLKTKVWLDERFKKVDEYGVYWAHQPIYGFRAGHSEPGLFERYTRTYQIMKSLSHIEFKTLLDVGGAEGYKAYLAEGLFNAGVTCSDLSEEACKRAREIFEIEAIVADIHELPFRAGEFDIVLCSETLEHVQNVERAVRELLRVAGKAVVITVPYESREEIGHYGRGQELHRHLHTFCPESFDFLKSAAYDVTAKKIISQCMADIASKIVDREFMPYNVETAGVFKKLFLYSANLCMPAANKLLSKRTAALMMGLDNFIASRTDSYHALLFVILKDKKCFRKKKRKSVSAYHIVNFQQPLHYLEREEAVCTICDKEKEGAFKRNVELASEEQKTFFARRLRNLSIHIDRFGINKDSFEMSGWAHISGKSSEDSKVYIILQSPKRTYLCRALTQRRPDVTVFFNNLNLDESGFCVCASTANLEKGGYRIGLYIEKDSHDRGFQFTDKNLIVGF